MTKMDLNLLRVFDALYELSSVTRAAERLGLTQSAISHALGRLRQAIGDPLFVRHASGLQPTARAIEIAPGIREGLQQLRSALSPMPFDPATDSRRFRINAGVYFSALLVPLLVARLRAQAPNVSLAVSTPGPDLLASLDNGSIDIALGAFGKAPQRLMRQPLYREQMVWIASRDNPVAGSPALLAALPAEQRLEVAVGRPYPGHGVYSWENGLERLVIAALRPGMPAAGDDLTEPSSVHDAITAIATVAATDLVALVPRQLALKGARSQRIAIIETGAAPDEIEMAMLWHGRLAGDIGLGWLRTQLRACIEDAMSLPENRQARSSR